MNQDLCGMDIQELTCLYDTEFDRLKLLLFRADDWDVIRRQQKIVTDLSAAMHQRLFSKSSHPAEFINRR